MPLNSGLRAFTITSSWDDGHPNDLKLVDLLAKHAIPATLYIPRSGQTPVLPEADIRRLSQYCEIGAHTLTHPDFLAISAAAARTEIIDSKDWLEQVTGKPCVAFCFPRGHFRVEHLRAVADAGYAGCRTVELLSLAPPAGGDVKVMGTTLQAFPHRKAAYLKNCLKRGRLPKLRHWAALLSTRPADWAGLARHFLREAQLSGGVFHLWGHSWELEGQWAALSTALSTMEELAPGARLLTNGELCLQ